MKPKGNNKQKQELQKFSGISLQKFAQSGKKSYDNSHKKQKEKQFVLKHRAKLEKLKKIHGVQENVNREQAKESPSALKHKKSAQQKKKSKQQPQQQNSQNSKTPIATSSSAHLKRKVLNEDRKEERMRIRQDKQLKYRKKTKFGQPVMKYRLEGLVEKIEEQSKRIQGYTKKYDPLFQRSK